MPWVRQNWLQPYVAPRALLVLQQKQTEIINFVLQNIIKNNPTPRQGGAAPPHTQEENMSHTPRSTPSRP